MIKNIRYKAFATNSSSVHTPVIFDKDVSDIRSSFGNYFGWDPFILASKPAKNIYAASALFSNLAYGLKIPDEIAHAYVLKITGITPEQIRSIDHQSLPAFPVVFKKTWETPMLNMEYFYAYQNWLLNDRLVMYGGNDNEDAFKVPKGGKVSDKPLKEASPLDWICRKDPKGFFSLFNNKSGTKLRVAFNNEDTSKSTVPELVDLKITNKCSQGCKYCYQNSTPKGLHGDKSVIFNILTILSHLNVFEVAIGGGEPTDHPDFWEIIESAYNAGITPNFSTRELYWISDPEQLGKFKKYCGAFAYSVDKMWQVTDFYEKIVKHDLQNKATVQLVVGGIPEEEFNEIINFMQSVSIKYTLLGYKKVGRGLNVIQNVYSNKTIRKAINGRAGVDTAFVQQFGNILKSEGADTSNYEIQEGKHSMYIDAVTSNMGPSSWCSKDLMEKLNTKLDYNVETGTTESPGEIQIVKSFAKW